MTPERRDDPNGEVRIMDAVWLLFLSASAIGTVALIIVLVLMTE